MVRGPRQRARSPILQRVHTVTAPLTSTDRMVLISERYSICGMTWGTVELEPEVRDWLEELSTTQFAMAAFYIDLLAEQGPLLSEPYTRQLDGKLRELRFHLGGQAVRVTYWIASGRRIVLLTVFSKTRMREIREIDRARRALQRCIAAGHTVDDDGEE